MVSSEEMRRRLDAKRKGVDISEGPGGIKPGQETVTCPECQTQNPTTAKFCVGCGASMVKEEPKAPQTTETVTKKTEDFKVCPSCNQKNKPNAKFCIVCGHKFEDSKDSEETAEPVAVAEEEDAFPAAQEVLESSADEQTSSLDEQTSSPDEPTPEVETAKTLEPVHDESPAESQDAVIPEIKVPEHLKTEKIEEKPVEDEAVVQETKIEESSEEDIDPVEKIKKAKELLDIGAITQEEYDQIKSKYLEKI